MLTSKESMIFRWNNHKRITIGYTIMMMLVLYHYHQKVQEWKGMRLDPERPSLGIPSQVSGTRHKCLLVEDKTPSESSIWNAMQLLFIFPAVKFSTCSSLLPSLKVCHRFMRFVNQVFNIYTYTYAYVHIYVHNCWVVLNGVLMNSSEGVLGLFLHPFWSLQICSWLEVTGDWKGTTEIL